MQAKCKIVGTSSLIMHRFSGEKKDKTKKKDAQYSIEQDIKDGLYFDEKIGCYAPSTWIEASMREAAKNFKVGKGTAKATVLSSVFVEEEKIPFGKQVPDENYVCPVVVSRARIMKGRPKFNDWSLEFTLNFDDERLHPDTIKDILVEAGRMKGIGTWRPKHGRFKVENFEVQ